MGKLRLALLFLNPLIKAAVRAVRKRRAAKKSAAREKDLLRRFTK